MKQKYIMLVDIGSGKNNITIKKTENDKTSYDFWKVNYHDIDFDSLTPINTSGDK